MISKRKLHNCKSKEEDRNGGRERKNRKGERKKKEGRKEEKGMKI